MKVREDRDCGGTGLKLFLASDGQESCYTETEDKSNAGDILEWSFDNLGSCSSATMNLESTKVSLLTSGTNVCPEYLNIRTENSNLLAASYQIDRFESLTGKRSCIF